MIYISIIYWLAASMFTIWFMCNLGNKHNDNTFKPVWRVMLGARPGTADERVFILAIALFGGWFLVPFVFIVGPLIGRYNDWYTKRVYEKNIKATRKVNESLSEHHKDNVDEHKAD